MVIILVWRPLFAVRAALCPVMPSLEPCIIVSCFVENIVKRADAYRKCRLGLV